MRVKNCALVPRDIVFIGGSTVAEGIDPDSLGEARGNHYAIGLSGGTTSDVYFALRHACPQAPRVLIYGMTASDINDSRHEPHGPHSLMTPADVLDWRRTRPDAAEWVTRHYLRGQAAKVWNAYRYRHGISMWATTQADALVPGCCPESFSEAKRNADQARALKEGNGYAPTLWFATRAYSEMKANGWVAPNFEYLARYRTGSHLKYLHRLLDWAEAHETKVIIIDMPTTADLEARHPAEFAEYRERLTEVERERGVRVIRATRDATGLSDEHFADLIHLNRPGAIRFSTWLGQALKNEFR